MKKKRKLKMEDIDSKKSIIVIFPLKENPKMKTLGLVQDMICAKEEIIIKAKPIVYRACFEGEPIKFGIRRRNIGESYAEMIKKFESSEHEVLLLLENKGIGLSQKEFNRKLEFILHKMVTEKYWQELHKKLKEGYVV